MVNRCDICVPSGFHCASFLGGRTQKNEHPLNVMQSFELFIKEPIDACKVRAQALLGMSNPQDWDSWGENKFFSTPTDPTPTSKYQGA